MRNINVFRKLKAKYSEERLATILLDTLNEGKEIIADNAPIRTGTYVSSIHTEIHKTKTGIGGSIYTTMPQLRDWLENGTGIYRIDGQGRKTPWTYYDTYTGHFYTTRGMHPRPHWTPAREITKTKLLYNMKKGLR